MAVLSPSALALMLGVILTVGWLAARVFGGETSSFIFPFAFFLGGVVHFVEKWWGVEMLKPVPTVDNTSTDGRRWAACPMCGFEFDRRDTHCPDPMLPDGVQSASDLRLGDRAEVVCLGSSKIPRHSALIVYGLEPGAEITLIQNHPSCVLRIDETELALDREIAKEILVRVNR